MLRDGSFKEAKKLTKEDSLMALYRKETKKGYELSYNPYSGSWKETYKRIAEAALGKVKKGIHIHHKDVNKKNSSI